MTEYRNGFTEGQHALIERTAWAVIKADRQEHAEERKREMELLVAEVMTDVRAELSQHQTDCPARKYAGRLRMWATTGAACVIGCLVGAGLINVPTLLKWIAKL